MIKSAKKLAEIFKKYDVEYLFLGAILYGDLREGKEDRGG